MYWRASSQLHLNNSRATPRAIFSDKIIYRQAKSLDHPRFLSHVLVVSLKIRIVSTVREYFCILGYQKGQ